MSYAQPWFLLQNRRKGMYTGKARETYNDGCFRWGSGRSKEEQKNRNETLGPGCISHYTERVPSFFTKNQKKNSTNSGVYREPRTSKFLASTHSLVLLALGFLY